MGKKKRKEPIVNSERVIAKGESHSFETTLGKLKELFMSKSLPYEIKSVHVPRTNTSYFINYQYTKGFKYEKLAA